MTHQPETSDPYPELPIRHPGARPSDATDHRHAWEFTNHLPVTRPVVQPATEAPTRVLTIDPDHRYPDPFAASHLEHTRPWDRQPQPTGVDDTPARRMSVFPWVSVLLMLTAQGILGAATAIGQLPGFLGAVVMTGMAAVGLVLIVAELVHRNDRRSEPRSPWMSAAKAPRRDEHDGRSLKRRPVGRGAAEGGGAHRLPLGNTEILLLPGQMRETQR